MDEEALRKLRLADFLTGWSISVAADHVAKTRAILESTVDYLISIGPASSKSRRVELLRVAVAELNAANTGLICSIEREDLCDYFFALGHAADLGEQEIQDVVDGRDW